MDVLILATKDCSHRPILEKKLKELNVNYKVNYVEESPDDTDKYKIHGSPNLIVNGILVFRASPQSSLPYDEELKNYVNNKPVHAIN